MSPRSFGYPLVVIAALALGASHPGTAAEAAGKKARAPLVIAEQGDFYVGGQVVFSPATSSSGENDPNPGHVVIDQMYVQYQVPAARKYRLPVVMVHGSWHTGKTYGSTPDGREGWGTYFVRKGFSTYIVDDPNRGRSSYDMTAMNLVRLGMAPPSALPPILQRTNEAAWTGFRIGPAPGVGHEGGQFPVEAADQYFAQLTDNYRAPEENAKITAALIALLDRIGPAIVMTHSQSGPFGWGAALARPALVKGIVSVEPISLPAFTRFAELARVPVTIIRADFDSATAVTQAQTFVDNLSAAGGRASFIRLPEFGITGNSHMMMLERNNLEIADLVIRWIERNVRGVRSTGRR
jgi:pimeloyl-ACP methyl ester carboxylesterase